MKSDALMEMNWAEAFSIREIADVLKHSPQNWAQGDTLNMSQNYVDTSDFELKPAFSYDLRLLCAPSSGLKLNAILCILGSAAKMISVVLRNV